MRSKTPLIWLLLVIMGTAAMAQTFRGELTARYRDRWGSSAWDDQDLFTYLRLGFGDEAERGIGGAVFLRWDADLQTRANEIDDGDDDFRIYHAYVDVNTLERLDLRFGRQIVDEAEGFNLTGIKGVWAAPWKQMRLGLFAGQPVSYYSAVHGDELAGGLSFSMRPDRRASVRGSWIHLEEDETESDVVTLAYRRSFANGSNLYATARTLDFDVFNEVIGGSWHFDGADLLLTGNYRRQEDTNASTSNYFGGLSTIIGPSRPFHQLTVDLSRPFGELATVGVGYSQRELLDASENRSNQEFSRTFVNVVLTEQLLAGFEANVNVSRWDTDRDDQSTLGGGVARRFGENLRFELGTFYQKYDLRSVFVDEIPRERFDVRTTYLRGDWRVRNKYRVRVDFDRTTDSMSDDAYYEAELRVGLDLGLFGWGSSR